MNRIKEFIYSEAYEPNQNAHLYHAAKLLDQLARKRNLKPFDEQDVIITLLRSLLADNKAMLDDLLNKALLSVDPIPFGRP